MPCQIGRSLQRAGGELVCHEHIAEDPNSLPCDHGLDGMQLLAKAEMLHVLEFGRAAPSALGCGEPTLVKAFNLSLPGYCFYVVRRSGHPREKTIRAFSTWLQSVT